MLLPVGYEGIPSAAKPSTTELLPWVKSLPDTCFLALWQRWPSQRSFKLPDGYKTYIISFQLEPVDTEWVISEAKRISKPMIVLFDGNYYDFEFPENVFTMRYVCWHHQTQRMIEQFPDPGVIWKIKYKASAFCNRVTQSKLLVTTALLEHLQSDHRIISLSDWIEPKNIHWGQLTGNSTLDDLSGLFSNKYLGKKIRIDDFDSLNSAHDTMCNFWIPSYKQTVFNFTNESYHYSLMESNNKKTTMPGPFLTEKTLKCLIAGTAFIPVGQFDTYGSLSRLGLKFDYGLDLSWDSDPGNISRLVSIIDLVKKISNIPIDDLLDMTRESTRHNQDWIFSGDFSKMCESINEITVKQVLDMLY